MFFGDKLNLFWIRALFFRSVKGIFLICVVLNFPRTKQQKLEERQADVEYELRCILNKPGLYMMLFTFHEGFNLEQWMFVV